MRALSNDLSVQERYQEYRIARISSGEQAQAMRRRYTALLEGTFRQLIFLHRPDLVLEIGAHEAAFSTQIKKSLPDTKVHAFEAHPLVHEKYAKSAKAADVVYENLAILDRSGTTTFRVPVREDGAEIRVMTSTREFAARKHNVYEIEATTLDARFGAVSGTSAVWVDVEGAAAEVIAGGKDFFSTCKIAYLEVEGERKWVDQSLFADLIPALGAYGLVPVLRDVQRLKWQFNVIFLHEELLAEPAIEEAVDRHFELLFSV